MLEKMESVYYVDQGPELALNFLYQPSHRSNTGKDQMNGNTKHFSIDGATDCQHGFFCRLVWKVRSVKY